MTTGVLTASIDHARAQDGIMCARTRRKGLPASGRKQAGRRVARLNSAFSAFSRSSMCSRGSAYLSDTTTNQLHTTCGKTNNAHETRTAARPSPPKAKPCTHEHPRASAERLHAGPHARSLDSGGAGAVTRSVAKARVFVPFVCLCAELSRCGARPTPSSSSQRYTAGLARTDQAALVAKVRAGPPLALPLGAW